MSKKQEEFLIRLRETFRVEAAEHIEAMTSGLVTLERVADAERPALVEQIFRDAHSLKGAARAVSLAGAEALCQELESIFAAMKRGELAVSTGLLDTIHPVLDVITTLCATPGVPETPAVEGRKHEALTALRRVLGASTEGAVTPVVAPAAAAAAPAPTAETVRVSARKLGAIMREAEEMVGAKLAASGRATELRALAADVAGWNQRRAGQLSRRRRGLEGAAAAAELLEAQNLYTRKLEGSLRTLAGSAHHDALALAAMTDGLLEDIKKVLLLPCSYLFGTLPKVLRDLAREQGREAELVVEGEDIEIDRRVLDELKDPLIHLLRNCADHGIEAPGVRRAQGKPARGTVTIAARAVEGNNVELTVRDDGAGIDADKVRKAGVRHGQLSAEAAAALSDADAAQLIFHSGLSTSPIITTVSGRGLGLAIVREKIERLGGSVAVTTATGVGTTFRIVVPSSLSTFRGVFVEVAGQHFVFPTASVERVARVTAAEVKSVENRQVIAVGDEVVALVRLRDVLQLAGPDGRMDGTARPVVVVRAEGRKVAFLVDEVRGEQEVMFKHLGQQLPRVRHISGASISGSGSVVPVLDVVDLLQVASTVSAAAVERAGMGTEAAPARRARLLVAEDSITARTLVKSTLESAGYDVVTTVDGLEALTALRAEAFDLLVSDVDMPRMNGFELTARIRADKHLGELPVVLVTALSSQKDREYGIEVGANAYIAKSDFDQSNLVEIVRRLL